MKCIRLLATIPILLSITGFAEEAVPNLGAGRQLAHGVVVHEVRLLRQSKPMSVWLYLPDPLPGRVPCVLVAPAGTFLVNGIGLSDGDRPEHIPYAMAGFVVVAYSLDGPLSPDADDAAWLTAIRDFMAADGGLANASAALDYALVKVPSIDRHRIYAAGHSSAAVLALQLAAADNRIRRVAAYAPEPDLISRLGSDWIDLVDENIPGFKRWASEISPLQNVAKITSPVLLFFAEDDDVVSIETGRTYAVALRNAGKEVVLEEAKSGGHYQSMIDEGISRGIRFFQVDK